MLVKELIEVLQGEDQHAIVLPIDDGIGLFPVQISDGSCLKYIDLGE